MHVDRSIDVDTTVGVLDRIAARRGRPRFVRCDNGPELTAFALAEWCATTVGTAFIDPGSPWQNAWVESSNSRRRDECVAVEQFNTLLEAQVVIGDWCRSAPRRPPPSQVRDQLRTCPPEPTELVRFRRAAGSLVEAAVASAA